MGMSSISVVVACYNGEKTIVRQLDSLRKQTRRPDEVLIFDDASIDRSAEVIEEYIEKYKFDTWKLIRNKTNVGWKQNFFQGVVQCSNNIIFLCDQDDEWQHEKIQKMTGVLETHPNINLLACDYEIKYGIHSIPMRKYRKKGTERNELINQYLFTTRFFQNPSPGCTYAVRKPFIKNIMKYWFPEAPHDEFMWLLATMTDSAWFYNEKLMTIFRGESNASDVKYKDIKMQLKNIEYIHTMLDKLDQYTVHVVDRCVIGERKDHISAQKIEALKGARVWCEKRRILLKKRNPFLWLNMMAYWKYYNSFRNCLSDLYLVMFGCFHRRTR